MLGRKVLKLTSIDEHYSMMIHTRKEDSEMMNMTSILLKPLAEVVAMVEPKVAAEEEDMEEAEAEVVVVMVVPRVVDPRTRK